MHSFEASYIGRSKHIDGKKEHTELTKASKYNRMCKQLEEEMPTNNQHTEENKMQKTGLTYHTIFDESVLYFISINKISSVFILFH